MNLPARNLAAPDGQRRPAARGAPAASGPAAVSVASLSKRYGAVTAVADLTFDLAPGTVTGFLGPNGAGKSTPLRMLVGLAEPTSGHALVLGRRYADLDDPARRVGAMLESGDFDPGRSGRNHLRTLAVAAAIPDRRVEEVLGLVRLQDSAHRKVRGYSLGMRQRLGLAAALLGDPEILLLDEPANGLDPAGVRWLRDLLRRLAAEGRTILVSSHVLAEVAQTVQTALIINHGRLVATVAPAQLTGGPDALEDLYLSLTAEETA